MTYEDVLKVKALGYVPEGVDLIELANAMYTHKLLEESDVRLIVDRMAQNVANEPSDDALRSFLEGIATISRVYPDVTLVAARSATILHVFKAHESSIMKLVLARYKHGDAGPIN